MHNLIVFYTFIALIVFFISVEIYRAKNYIKGIIVGVQSNPLGIETMVNTTLHVKLNNGETVDAEAFACTMCMGNFSIGDQVYLSKSKNKYIVNIPFRFTKKTDHSRTCSDAKFINRRG